MLFFFFIPASAHFHLIFFLHFLPFDALSFSLIIIFPIYLFLYFCPHFLVPLILCTLCLSHQPRFPFPMYLPDPLLLSLLIIIRFPNAFYWIFLGASRAVFAKTPLLHRPSSSQPSCHNYTMILHSSIMPGH